MEFIDRYAFVFLDEIYSLTTIENDSYFSNKDDKIFKLYHLVEDPWLNEYYKELSPDEALKVLCSYVLDKEKK